MASSTSTLSRQHGAFLLPSIARLAGWRFKQTWRFLFVTWMGMLAMVVLVCALPLFSRVAITANLRTLAASAPGGQNIQVQVATNSPGTQQVQQIQQQVDSVLKQNGLDTYLQGTPRFIVQTPPLNVLANGRPVSTQFLLDAYDSTQTGQHLTLVQGRAPRDTTNGTVEIAIVQNVASSLGLHVGSTISGRFSAAFGLQTWPLHIVGIIVPASVHDSFWSEAVYPFGSRYTTRDGTTGYTVLAPLETVRSRMAALQATSAGEDLKISSFRLVWSYPFNLSHLDANNVGALSQQTSNLESQLDNTLTRIPGVLFAFPSGALFDTLSNYGQQIVVLQIVITLLLLIILAIVLFLVSMLSDMLVERQAAIIAMLRSRGATRRHVFGAFVVQSLVLGLAALLVGPLLAILLVRAMSQALFTSADSQSLNVIITHPIQSVLDVKWYALIAVVVALFVMIVAVRRASQVDIVTLRRESSRTKRVPFWRRLNLDLLLVLLILVGYAVYVYSWQSFAATQQIDPVLYNLLRAVGFIAPPLLVAAALLLCLRFLPRILRLASSLAAKKKSAPAVLALAQMERTPRSAARVIVLLALAIAASCFLSTLIATKEQRTSDAATFAVGADFSGPLPAADASKTFAQLKTQYSHLQGVQSATPGYYNQIEPASRETGPTRILAVDAGTYARTALWSTQNSSQPLSDLTAQLDAHRADATARNVVYALIDAALAQKLHLAPGASFTLPMNDTGTLRIHFVILAQVNYIPGIYDTPDSPDDGVGLLVDYSSYATVYARESGMPLSPNFVLLRTQSDAASLAHIRAMFPGLDDRRALTTANQQDTVHLDILGVLAIGIGAALILALVGTLLSSWLNASNRRTSFAVARALGMAPRQVAAVLLWEQGFVYILAFLLGIGLGALLTIFSAPVVSLLDLAGTSNQGNPFDVPPVQTMIPYPQLLLLLGALVVVCIAALLLMARIVSRPSIGQTLRLNED